MRRWTGAEVTWSISGLEVELIIALISSPTFAMPRFRKSKKQKDDSVSTPTSPADLVRGMASQRNSMALAATSAAIALSIGSAFSDTRDTSSGGPPIQERDTGWQTAYDAIRMAVETIKESSDMFLPLKAVVGAVSVLMKNYDVSASYLQTGHLLILRLFPIPANFG